MRALVWPLVERRVRRHLPSAMHAPVLGDLEEDFSKQVRLRGRAHAEMWLMRESVSLSSAYRAEQARQQRTVGDPAHTRNMAMGFHLDEVTLASRRLVKQPGASVASVFTLACGLAAAATTWSLLSAVLLDPLPVASPQTLQVIGLQYAGRGGSAGTTYTSYEHVYPTYPAIRDSEAFEQVAAIGRYALLVGEGDRPQSRDVYFASHNFFATLGVRVASGAGFRPEDDQRGAPPVVVLSDRYWRLRLDADPQIIGKTITVGGATTTVVGITPPGFRGLSLTAAPDFYMPMSTLPALIDPNMNFFSDGSSRSSPTAWLTIIGRVKGGETIERAGSQLATYLDTLPPGPGWGGATPIFTDINTASLPEISRAGMRQFGQLLGATVGLLLLIGSLTVGMLLLIRTEARRDELTMCLALGATRGRLASGVVLEGILLTLGGVLLSAPLAVWLFAGISAFELPGGVDLSLLELSAGVPTLIAVAFAAMLTSTVIGLVAGLFGISANIGDVLRARAGATPRLTRRRTRMFLVGSQVAVTLVLLAGTGLFARSLSAALHLNPGFDPGQVVAGSIELRPYGYTPPRADAFFADLLTRLQNNASIQSVSMTVAAGGMTPRGQLIIDGEPRQFPSTVAYTHVDEHYFSTMSMRIVGGRDFTADDGPSAPLAIIVSESFGRMLANGADPVGHTITESSGRPGQPRAVARIVGVVPDVVTRVTTLEPLAIYYSLAQKDTYTGRNVVFRAAGDPAVATREVMATIRALDPQVSPSPFATLQERIALQMGPQNLGVTVLGGLSIIAVLLTVLGTFVLAETMAAARKREMGIRAALGATRRQLGDLVLRETVQLVGVGLIAGLGLAWLGAETIRAFLFQVEPLDAATLAGVSALILFLALAVSLRPAVRAGRVELSQLLREE